jgi:hypothetical protein
VTAALATYPRILPRFSLKSLDGNTPLLLNKEITSVPAPAHAERIQLSDMMCEIIARPIGIALHASRRLMTIRPEARSEPVAEARLIRERRSPYKCPLSLKQTPPHRIILHVTVWFNSTACDPAAGGRNGCPEKVPVPVMPLYFPVPPISV